MGKKGRKPLPDAVHRRARELKVEGFSPDDIATTLKISVGKVYEYLRHPAPRKK